MNVKSTILEETIKTAYKPDAYMTRYNKGLEHIVEGSKISLNLAVQQNAFFLGAIKQAMNGSLLPNPFGFDLGGQAFEGCVAIQKNLLNMALEQSTAMIEAIQESGQNTDKAMSEFSNMVQQSLIAAQKEITELAVNPLNSAAAKD
jgi:hypothetical protein